MKSQLVASMLAAMFLATVSAAQPEYGDVLTLGAFKRRVCFGDVSEDACRRRIDSLDRRLNIAFQDALRVAPNKTELRSRQRRWLAEVRDQRSVLNDVVADHVSRTLELQEIAVRAIGRLEKPMGAAEQREICEGIANEASRGDLMDRVIWPSDMRDSANALSADDKAVEFASRNFVQPMSLFSLPITRDKKFPFSDVFTGGSCSSSQIRPAAPPLEQGASAWPSDEIDPDEEDDVIRWATWGSGEAVLMFGGRYFFVTSQTSANSPGIVTWVTPIGTRRPICSLEVDHVERTASFVRDDAALCSAAARDEMSTIDWRAHDRGHGWTAEERELLVRSGIPGSGMPGFKVATVDINNDGVTETIGSVQYDSGAGCGGSMSRLMLMTQDGHHLKTGPLNDALMGLEARNSKPVEVHAHRSTRYVSASLDNVPALVRVTQDAIETECLFRDQPISRVRKLYPLDGPVRDPADSR